MNEEKLQDLGENVCLQMKTCMNISGMEKR